MHEYGITRQILDTALEAAEQEGAIRINEIKLSVGELTEIVEDALQFSFEILKEDTIAADATLTVTMVKPRSKCQLCEIEYEHDKFDLTCPECGAFFCDLLEGRELRIDSIDADLPDE